MIEVSHLTKRYGNHLALSDLSFTIPNGQIYGLLGPNGAGKSTTMNILTGCLAATSGEVRIDGVDIFEDPMAAKRHLGYLPEQPPVYMDRTPWEYLRFVARAKGVKNLAQEVDRVMDLTQIADVRDRLIRNLSKGYRQRVGIAQAILGSPRVIILDEPTVGLDPIQIIEIRDLIQELGREHTVILSSHILSEVQAVCQKVLILSRGRLVAYDRPENLEKLLVGNPGITFRVEAGEPAAREILLAAGGVASFTIQEEASALSVSVALEPGRSPKEVCGQLTLAFAAKGLPVFEMQASQASLEDVFLELTESGAQEEGAQKEDAQ